MLITRGLLTWYCTSPSSSCSRPFSSSLGSPLPPNTAAAAADADDSAVVVRPSDISRSSVSARLVSPAWQAARVCASLRRRASTPSGSFRPEGVWEGGCMWAHDVFVRSRQNKPAGTRIIHAKTQPLVQPDTESLGVPAASSRSRVARPGRCSCRADSAAAR